MLFISVHDPSTGSSEVFLKAFRFWSIIQKVILFILGLEHANELPLKVSHIEGMMEADDADIQYNMAEKLGKNKSSQHWWLRKG